MQNPKTLSRTRTSPHAIWLTGMVALALPLMAATTARAAEDDDKGLLAFNGACGTCHTLRDGDNRLGPTLHGIMGRKAGAITTYGNYTTSMKDSGLTWDEATLDKFIENPESVVPGNGMKPYAGTTDPAVRAQIIGFLKACEKCGSGCPAPKKCTPSESTPD